MFYMRTGQMITSAFGRQQHLGEGFTNSSAKHELIDKELGKHAQSYHEA